VKRFRFITFIFFQCLHFNLTSEWYDIGWRNLRRKIKSRMVKWRKKEKGTQKGILQQLKCVLMCISKIGKFKHSVLSFILSLSLILIPFSITTTTTITFLLILPYCYRFACLINVHAQNLTNLWIWICVLLENSSLHNPSWMCAHGLRLQTVTYTPWERDGKIM
jgi:hypothetical protein